MGTSAIILSAIGGFVLLFILVLVVVLMLSKGERSTKVPTRHRPAGWTEEEAAQGFRVVSRDEATGGSGSQGSKHPYLMCPECGQGNIEMIYRGAGTYPRYQCKDCGKVFT